MKEEEAATATAKGASNEDIIQLFGDAELWHTSTKSKAAPSKVLSDKVILLYFSAHWCGPCRRFTPILKDYYLKQQEENNKDPFEIVFMSMDRTKAEYESYTSKMPWYCLPHQHSSMSLLSSRYEARGIPHLVILDKDGSLISMDGVGLLTSRPEEFPWRPKPIPELLPSHYLEKQSDGTSKEQPFSKLENKYLMLYFSAHWCPPCKRFTPVLSKAYSTLKKHHEDDFELLFVSSDQDQASFDEYWSTMTFGAIPFSNRAAKMALSKRLGIRGIPALVMISQDHQTVINENVRGILETEGDYVSDFPFVPKPYGDLNQSADAINKYPCIVVFHELGDDAEHEDVQEALQLAAKDYEVNTGAKMKNMRFYWALTSSGLVNTLRDALKIGKPKEEPVLALVNVPDGGSFYLSPKLSDIDASVINEFMLNPGEKKYL